MLAVLREVGAVICAAGDGLAPADKKLYALRDVTGTVESIPLIASLDHEKKIAEGTGALVLDVKVGSGAFMKDVDSARELARTMVGLGTDAGVDTVPCSPPWTGPSGSRRATRWRSRESVEVLAGGGPADVVELTVLLAREMLDAAGVAGKDPERGPARRLRHGRVARDDRGAGRRPGRAAAHRAATAIPCTRPASGVLVRLDAYGIGVAAWRLGAGRARKEDPVQRGRRRQAARTPGDPVVAGQPLLTLHTDDESRLPASLEQAARAVEVGPVGTAAERLPLVIDRIGA